ncbi:MAG: PKD domain-containing protein, partial [Bacteroidetes bacterium]
YTSNLPNPSHTYTSIDSFDVRLIVTGVGGCPMAKRKNSYIKIEPLKTRFSASVRGGCAPLMVIFDDTTHSPSPILSWQWDFGDGATSTLETPTHIYQDTGVYNVRLIVTNALGCSDTLIKTNYISAGNLPTVNFVADTLQACALTEVHFTNLSQGASQFIWMFGDGDTAMSFNVSHGFAALGPIDVTLIGSDRGCRDTLFLDDYINVLAPLPLMGISDKQICTLPFTVQVENLSIGDDAWEWMIDGTIPISQHNFSYTFTTEGSHSVLLTVRNFFTGCVTRALDSILIKTVNAAIEPDDDRGCMPHAVQFTDRSTNAVKWWWRFGTGDSSIVKNPAYTYSNSGTYDVRLVVENSLRCRDTAYYQSIHSIRAQADFGVTSAPAGCLPLRVQFEDRSGGNSPVNAWNWSFGDGGTSTQRHPSHTYQQPSYYDVKLKVRNADGCTDSLTRSSFIFVTQPLP